MNTDLPPLPEPMLRTPDLAGRVVHHFTMGQMREYAQAAVAAALASPAVQDATSDIHSCSYHCTRPACVKAQRDELVARFVAAPDDGDWTPHANGPFCTCAKCMPMATVEDSSAVGVRTGWPPGLLQDDDRKLSKWLASKPDARMHVRDAATIKDSQTVADWTEPHPPSRQCMCPACIPSFDERFAPVAARCTKCAGTGHWLDGEGDDYCNECADGQALAVLAKLHEGKIGAHWLWVVIQQIAAGGNETGALREFGYCYDASLLDKPVSSNQVTALASDHLRLALQALDKQQTDIARGLILGVIDGLPDADDLATIEKLSNIIHGFAVALKGPEAPLSRHSWHDLAEIARSLKVDTHEVCARIAETKTARARWARGAADAQPTKPCEIAAAIRKAATP